MKLIKNSYPILLIIIVVAAALYFITKDSDDQLQKFAIVKRGLFQTSVTELGELKASVATDILSPHTIVKEGKFLPAMEILELVPEGTYVNKGDKVAVLSPGQIMAIFNQINSRKLDMQQQIEQSRLDSSLSLAQGRDQLRNLKEQIIDTQLKVDQSIYESKSVQRQAQMELEKLQRKLASELRNYDQKQRRLKRQLARTESYNNHFISQTNKYQELMNMTIVSAPSDGIVIYADNYGHKVRIGSNVSGWQPRIATLPDLRFINSEVMIRETDIAKVSRGQKVTLKLEALPGKTFEGEVNKIANIGKPLSNQHQIGFEVMVKVNVPEVSDHQYELFPGMTSTNTIITGEWNDALFIDKQAVIEDKGLTYVLMRKGTAIVRKEIKLGEENETTYHILEGLNEGDKVFMEFPEGYQTKKLIALNTEAN